MESTEWMHGRKVGLLPQMRCLLLNYAHGVNRPAGLVGRGHGRCTGGRGADPHTPSAAGKCCWPGHRRPRPPRSFFPQILQTVKSIQWWQWYSSVNNNEKKEQEKLPEAINLQFKPCLKWACWVFYCCFFFTAPWPLRSTGYLLTPQKLTSPWEVAADGGAYEQERA